MNLVSDANYYTAIPVASRSSTVWDQITYTWTTVLGTSDQKEMLPVVHVKGTNATSTSSVSQ